MTIISSKILPTTIGFDRFFEIFNELEKTTQKSFAYPPYSIIKSGNRYIIEVAVAGFAKEDIFIEANQNVLTISGNYRKPEVEPEYLHKGISTKDFIHTFRLVDNCVIKPGSIQDGILSVVIEVLDPTEKQPRKIPII